MQLHLSLSSLASWAAFKLWTVMLTSAAMLVGADSISSA
jgi:hypothetical protein